MKITSYVYKDVEPILARARNIFPMVAEEQIKIRALMNEYFDIPFVSRKEAGITSMDIREGPSLEYEIFLKELIGICILSEDGKILISAHDLRYLEYVEKFFDSQNTTEYHSVIIEEQIKKIREFIEMRDNPAEKTNRQTEIVNTVDTTDSNLNQNILAPAPEKEPQTAFIASGLAFIFIAMAIFTYFG